MKLFVGCSGFYNSSWKTVFYPEKLPQKKWFEHYATQFNSLEINSSFYRYPKLQVLEKWVNESPADFLFAVKAPRTVTHYRKFNDVAQPLKDFYNLIEEGLKDKLGPVLFQLPPSYSYTAEHLEQIIKALDPRFLNVIEFRHASWMLPEIYAALEHANITYCSMSHPSLPDDLISFGKTAYIRFHGVPKLYFSEYSDEYLNKWAEKIKQIKPEKCFIYFNNTITPAAISNARFLLELLT
ncbi:MAG TPA: DUF72 domain-containing protein [Sphingobacteriaceae bacterium]|nr:DUF72 domain-containing protein [Sphingobacteriaceae bacterium]